MKSLDKKNHLQPEHGDKRLSKKLYSGKGDRAEVNGSGKSHSAAKQFVNCDGRRRRGFGFSSQKSSACSTSRRWLVEIMQLTSDMFPRTLMSSSEHFDSDNENHSYSDIHRNGGSQNIGQTRRKGRGHDKPKWGKSGKEKIEFTKDGLCIVPKDAKLSRYLGSLARTYNFLPLSHTDWRSYKHPDTIDWRPEDISHIHKIRHTLLKRFAKRVRNNRAELKKIITLQMLAHH
ncbi:Uncharacterized protein Fot_35590 [Forsythia ovata]|uniref:Uncharacterized protein n=1 Tax=Forsythia ovata TaxID=205694 RepID=A0ABD1SPZ0_9LAMI